MTLNHSTTEQHSSDLQGKHPTLAMGELDKIVDLYYLESITSQTVTRKRGGQGSYCFIGTPYRIDLRGTEIAEWVDRLAAQIEREYPTEEDFRVEFEGRSFRGCRDYSSGSSEVALRRMPSNVPALQELDFENKCVRKLLEGTWLNNGGLVVICGLTGQGKTVVAGSTVRTRLEAWGGRAVTTEDPPELPLEGLWGQGACRQIQVTYGETDSKKNGFAGALRRAYRKLPATRPAIMFVGEVRDEETAAELIKAALNGMLVICTVHAMDQTAALRRISSLAEPVLGESTNGLLAQALRLVVHNKLVLNPNKDGWKRGQFSCSIMVSDHESHPVASTIREGRWQQLGTLLTFQATHLRQAELADLSASDLLTKIGSKAPEYQGMKR